MLEINNIIMNEKKYKICRLAVIIILSISISISVSLKQYYLPLVFLLTAFASIYYCRKQLKTNNVQADERDYAVAGHAARYSIYIYSWLGAISMFILMAISDGVGILYYISLCLAFSVCFLMLTNAFLFKYFHKKGHTYEK
jgi:uncharacterized membrane protein